MALAKRLVTLIGTLLFLSTAAIPTAAIMNGGPDGNAHRNVGMVGALLPGNVVVPVCSGFVVARSPTLSVVLTAGHCTQAITDLGATRAVVSFSSNLSMTLNPAVVGVPVTDPAYGGGGHDRHDFGAIVISGNLPSSAMPVRLPTEGLLDELRAAERLGERPFTAVGYGAVLRLHENDLPDDPETPGKSDGDEDGGPWIYLSDLRRNRAISGFNALNPAVIHLSQNPALGDGGTCHGDSGGPYFIVVDGQETAVGLTRSGDPTCRATTIALRLDAAPARTFLTSLGVAVP